ncbi:MAG: hypothetical protein ACI89X_002306 [Planctomycetota bacterium]|jgi:hypothetical protein
MSCQLFLIVIALIAGLCVGGLRRSIKQQDEQDPEGKSKHRLTGAWIFVIVLAALTLTWNWACFSSKNVFSSVSPNAAWKLIVEQRCAFPRNTFVDPMQRLGIRLIDSKTGETLAYTSASLEQGSDFRAPDVTWVRGGAQVKGFNSRKDVQLDLVVPKD